MPKPRARSLRRTQRLEPEDYTVQPVEPDDEVEVADAYLDEDGRVTMTPIDGGPPITDTASRRTGARGRISVAARKAAFLEAFKASGTVSFAARIAGVHRATHTGWIQTDPKFAKAFEETKEDFIETLEQEAVRRARDGIQKSVYYQGEVVGNMQEYSDSLLQFLLRANRAGKYRDNKSIEHTGPSGGALRIQVVYTDEATEEEDAEAEELT